MADFVFNQAKGAVAEKVRDAASNVGVLLLKAADTDTVMKRTATITALLATSADEMTDASYSRKTGITGTVTVDNTNDRVDTDIPDQTWTALSGSDNVTDAVIFYEDSASDSGRVPMTCHDFAITPDGSDVTMQVNAAGFHRAS